MTQRKPHLLLSNDDGIDAPGIRTLWARLHGRYRVSVVAPARERSGAGCSLSLSNEMRVDERHDGDFRGFAVDGTPADCVKFALTALKIDRPDLVLSGINRGVNLGNSVFYSGTVAAAIEATLYGLPAMACSLGCWGHPEAYYDDAAEVVELLVPWLLRQPPRPRTLWNLNVPNLRFADIRGLRLTAHGTSFFEDDFELYRTDGDTRYYRNVGHHMEACRATQDADDHAWTRGEVSLTLLRTDLTVPVDQECRDELASLWARRHG
jgi:5'-nucleotidase